MAEEIDFLTIESVDSDPVIRLEDAVCEQPGDSTYHDHKSPVLECGDDFVPRTVGNCEPAISRPPVPLSFFQLFLSISLVKGLGKVYEFWEESGA